MEGVTPQMRREAKVINFGILYGMSSYGLSQQLGVEPKVAQAYIDEYFKKYAGVQAYIEHGILRGPEKRLCDNPPESPSLSSGDPISDCSRPAGLGTNGDQYTPPGDSRGYH